MLDPTKAPDLGAEMTDALTVRMVTAFPAGTLYTPDRKSFRVVVVSAPGWPKFVIPPDGRARLVRPKKGRTGQGRYAYATGREYKTHTFDDSRSPYAPTVAQWVADYVAVVRRLTPAQRRAAGMT